MRREIPSSWAWAPLSDLGTWYGGGTPSKSNLAYWESGTIPWVSPKDMKVQRIWDSEDHITDEAIKNSATTLIPPGAVLIVTRSGILRHTVPVAVTEVAVTINQDLKALVPHSSMSATYIAYALRAFESEILSRATKSGTTVQSIETPILRSLEIPVAPTAEQERIVAEIEKQFTRIEAATAGLRRVQAKLKAYRAAVLKAACEGRLVSTEAKAALEEGREYTSAEDYLQLIAQKRRAIWSKFSNRGVYREPQPPPVADLPNLPDGWTWVTWEQVGFCQNGRAFPSSDYQMQGIKLLRPGNLHDSGKVVWSEKSTRRLSEEWTDRCPDLLVGPGELIMNLTAQSLKDEFLGRICLTGEGERCLLNQRLARLTPVEVSPRYLLWLLKSPAFRRFVDGLNKGSLIQHMFTSQIQEFLMPLPPFPEQERIADEAERRISIVESVADAIEQQISRSQVLRNSLLNTAFTGKLVQQDSSDEPANILLDRIHKTRAGQEDVRPQRGRGIKPGVSTPGNEPQHPPKPRRGAGNNDRELASAPSGLPDESGDASLGLKPQALCPGPFRAESAVDGDATRERSSSTGKTEDGRDFLGLSREEQIDHVWESLLGLGAVEKDEAIRHVANDLREKGLARFQRLRQGGALYEAISSAITRGVRAGSFDRPRRGTVRALLPDAREYSPEEWRRCLLGSLNNHAIDEEAALRAAADWARENMGLEFSRLREDGVILRGLREALNHAVRRGEIQRKRGQIHRAPNKSGPTGRESLALG